MSKKRAYGIPVEQSVQTGFPSACSEYGEGQLSLDEAFNMGGPEKRLVPSPEGYGHLGILKGDLLHIDMSLVPWDGDLVLVQVDEHLRLFRFYRAGLRPELLSQDQMERAEMWVVTGMSGHRDLSRVRTGTSSD